jgi:hypothetical protein
MPGAGVIVFFFGLAILSAAIGTSRKEMLISDTQPTTADSIELGRTVLYGIGLSYGAAVKTPFSGKDCIWCHWTVDKMVGGAFKRVKEGVTPHFFLVKDGTGKILVYTKGAEVDSKYHLQFSECPTPESKQFLNNEGIDPDNTPGIRLTESFLAPNENVYVLGTAKKNPYNKGEADIREEEFLVCKGDDIFYIKGGTIEKIREYASRNLRVYLAAAFILMITGLIFIVS